MGSPGRLERVAVELLRDVGGAHEWWYWNPSAKVGHLRVPVTVEEYQLVPPGCALIDAGYAGLRRPRTYARR